MQEWSTPLVAAIGVFLAGLIWRVRPAWPWGRKRAMSRESLRAARARVEGAKDPADRARALCDAAEITAKGGGGYGSAAGLFQRALRTDPASPEIVTRTAAGLSARPRALESLLWRALAGISWTGDTRAAARASLEALQALYEGPLKNSTRARALANAREALS